MHIHSTVVSRLLFRTHGLYKLLKYHHVTSRMGDLDSTREGLALSQVLDAIHSFAPIELAASWDNVGLLIEPTKSKLITHTLITNDLTEDVMQEAIDLNADLIISYHPPIFSPLKSITTRTWKERIASTCIENKIALYSPHTSFDSVKGGLNDWLAGAFDLETCKPIEAGVNPENGFGRLCTLKVPVSTADAVTIVKQRTNLPHVRLARARRQDDMITSIAVCAGSGSSVLKGVRADLYITGEMLHHDILDAIHLGANVILTNHSDSERGFLKLFAIKLRQLLGESVKVSLSLLDTDPLKTV
ncbi:NIF3-like protein 1 isoform X2 [Neodiprion virginianus]|uniref:NIF3-like protein 1 n=1 Tax=Neodiprion lecontei TaxID=441921 RepID=A0A6J0BMA0_NEOLC|nr:NIF3-like protein 1 isoform X2 [Neodiprion lecontei]XP_046426031.1 NIF3-like protein 1 isoform X2 [Neodiprion fabricii]XP_046426032.1 NIF3-like protein 1 isoform X2 [Neodiprion fabricii]XP_046426033.1 NIF3-like protein 1 isoform X2 [Neodiprion fabricii]XP_046596979.1 NIF3-like protein 1 isoform X2 [Neodiprion lecontei]XP_046596981.1 NIF3-like protein 1 isoform X2 [Neodiprion lecontei]XP_046620035.1 NIF3-like protein 1 isoform X2 [Neodiprion virginianus]XP_046620036.1 NIF3-like protein 1 i